MSGSWQWLRVFVSLLLALLPPILLLVGALFFTEPLLPRADPALVAIFVVIGSIGWAGILALFYARSLADDVRSLLALARRGDPADDPDLGAAYRQLASSLDERNRQVGALARQASMVAIDAEPRVAVAALVSAVRLVIRDATWRIAVLSSDDETLLPARVYHAMEDESGTDPVGDLEQWASVSDSDLAVRHIVGQWGAFVVVDLAASDRLRGILYAPWEGRAEPTPAEIDLLQLAGQHAGTALEHSLLYARVRSQADELNRLAAIQADFLRGVTHDLQTPLASIGALATELWANELIPADAREDLDAISHQAGRLRRMVSQLLVASRLEAGALTAQQDVFAVLPIIERTWTALRAEREFELSTDGVPHLAVADPDRLEQVLWAVLDNAVKYSPEGSPVEVHVSPDHGHLVISIRDRGVGMGDESRRQAFEQFYRAAEARRLAPDGSGVGLYAARGLMHAMGGSIDLDSVLGTGTTISIRVPAESAEETAS